MDLIKLNPVQNVAASGRATLTTDECIGRSVHGLIFAQGGTFTKAHLTNINVRMDGTDIIDSIAGDDLQDLNDYDGLPDVSNYLCHFFGDPTARTVRGQHLGDLDCAIYNKPLEFQFDIGAATNPTLDIWAITGVPKLDMGIGFSEIEAAHMRALVYSQLTPSAAVTKQTYGISMGSGTGQRLRKVGFFHTNLTSVEMKKSRVDKWDDVPLAVNSAFAQQFARVPQSGLYVLDRIADGNQGEAETTVDAEGRPWNFRIALTTSASDTIKAYADVHATLGML